MDWGRAKTILILSFLFLNIMLGYEFWSSKINLLEAEAEPVETIEEVNRLMLSKGIRLQTEIPKEAPSLREIVVTLDNPIGSLQRYLLKAPIQYQQLLTKEPLDELISKTIEQAKDYRFDPIISSETTYILHQMHGEYPIFGVRLELYPQNGEIRSYRKSHAEVQTEQREQRVISAFAAIRTLVETYLPEGAVIRDVRLGYHGQYFNSDQSLLLPTWRVTTFKGDSFYVNAFTGGVMD
jgi:regulatory protein YycI of two-component signal transduction system YycFG